MPQRDGIEVAEFGQGLPLVLVHGWRLDSSVERADIEPIGHALDGWRRIYLDLPGMGQSPVLPTLKTLADYANWLSEWITRTLPDQRFALAGTSGGAALCLRVALRNPSLCRGLMLRMPLMSTDRAVRKLPSDPLPARLRGTREKRRQRLWLPAEDRVSPHVQALRNNAAAYNLPPLEGAFANPSLVITGRQDTRVGYAEAFELIDRLPRATFCILDGAEHEYPFGRRKAFNSLVSDWLLRTREQWQE